MVFRCKNEDEVNRCFSGTVTVDSVIFSESRGNLLGDLRYGSDAGFLSVSGQCLTKLLPKPLNT